MNGPRYRLLVQLACLPLPWKLRRWLLTKLLGFSIDPAARIGFSIVLADEVVMEKGAWIGQLNYVGTLDRLIMREESCLANFNWVTGTSRRQNTTFFKNKANRRSDLIMGRGCLIAKWHLVDCTDAVEFGALGGLAGARSQIVTHGVDYVRNRQACSPVFIGDYTVISTGSIVMKGVSIAERCIVAPGSVVMKSVREPFTMVAGNPAVVVRKLPENMKMHYRTETTIA